MNLKKYIFIPYKTKKKSLNFNFFKQTLQSQPTELNGNGQTVAIGDAGIDSAGCLSGTTTGFVFWKLI